MNIKIGISKAIYEKKIEDLDLSQRATNSLKKARMFTVSDILDRQNELPTIKSCGTKTVKEIKNAIFNMQLQYKLGENV